MGYFVKSINIVVPEKFLSYVLTTVALKLKCEEELTLEDLNQIRYQYLYLGKVDDKYLYEYNCECKLDIW